jgi:hypothetical protein
LIEGIAFHHFASSVCVSSVSNDIFIFASLSTKAEKLSPTIIPKNLARCEDAARRFETPLRKFEDFVSLARKEGK